jgi:hypothetical protein
VSWGVPEWPPGTVIVAIEDIPVLDWTPDGKQTVIRKGARGTVGTGDGGARVILDLVDNWYGSTVFDTVPLHHQHGDKFLAVLP